MTVWSPSWRVKVNGTDVTNVTLASLTITSGRTDIYSQPQAGYCSINLIKTDTTPITFEINDAVTIEIKKSDNTYVTLFGGSVTDLEVDVGYSGSVLIRQNIRIIALGALSRLTKAIFSGNLASDEDGDQMLVVLSSALSNQWNEVPAALDWQSYEPTVQWQDAENTGLGDIDTPGDYTLDSLSNLEQDVYSLAASIAKSGLGYLFEDAQGRIGYADSTHRSAYLAANGYIELDANQAYGNGLRTVTRTGDIRNSVTIQYGSAGNQSVSDSDPSSIGLYGEYGEVITTHLKNQSDAEDQAAFYLELRAYPQTQFRNITFPLGNPEIDNTDRDALLNVFMGMPVDISNLPLNISSGNFQGFVEGWTFQATTNDLKLALTISPVAYSLQAFRWNSVPATEQWQTITPTLDWQNATIVA